ncbi:MAG TPA: hypothetical protein VKD22_04150 [Ramlibacter sp.]|nr:hypothetical protein [Ramlibacter sp.]
MVVDLMPSLDAKVAALRLAGAYDERPAGVESIETHMSWVFLTPAHVYKLKKPVRADGLDFGTAERRHFYCMEELRLNRRLARSVYLDVLPVRQAADGTIRTFGGGCIVDWVVMMRRLPAQLMLDHLLARREAQPVQLQRVAEQLAAFYLGLSPAVHDPAVYVQRLARTIDECEARLCDPELACDVAQVRAVCANLRSFMRRHEDVLAARVRAGRIVEGHGDLRPEHVWLGTPPAIIDCLEFSPVLRTVDSADEFGFLALECERAGAPELGRVLLSRAAALTGDMPPPRLVDFYQALRGCVWAGIALWHLKEPRYHGAPVWRERSSCYLELAASHARRCLA